jgi:hypothetical protein
MGAFEEAFVGGYGTIKVNTSLTFGKVASFWLF